MENLTKPVKSDLRRLLLYIVLFASGISALIYQVVWIRKFGLVFGVHIYSISTVLTAFMAGLAIGSLLFGKIVDRSKNPLKVFFWLEAGIGCFAVLFPLLFDGLIHFYAYVSKSLYVSQYSIQLIRFFLSFLFLLIPTILMGGTLPVIIKYFVRTLRGMGSQVSSLYSVNNFGAVIGCFIAGFFLINNLGIKLSLYIGALLNLLNGAIVFFLSRKGFNVSENTEAGKSGSPAISEATQDEFSGEKLSPVLLRIILWVFAIEGFTTLAYEVFWTRILVGFSFDKTTYFFTTILTGFIFGLAFGSFLIRKYIDRIKNLLGTLVFIQVAVGLTSILMMIVFSFIAPVLVRQRNIFSSWMDTSGKEYLICFLLLIIPTTLMGFTYPVVSKIYSRNLAQMGQKMGVIGFMDTAGSILGSFAAGFLMIPFLGVVNSFLVTAGVNILLGILVIIYLPDWKTGRKILISLGCTAGLLVMIFLMPSKDYFSWWNKLENRSNWFGMNYEKVLYYDEGEAATVMILQYPDEEKRALMINGHNTAYTSSKDLSLNRQLGYMPYILHPNPKNAMVIGFGLGVTAHTLTLPDIDYVDVAEIDPGVIKGAPVLRKWNFDVQKNPKARIFDEDGRSLLFMTDKKYDIITSNAIHPRLSNNIYTRDFYEICKAKLADDGILCQMIPQNWLTETEYKSLVKAFVDVFPNTTLWYVNEYSTLAIGSIKPQNFSFEAIREKFKSPQLSAELEESGIRSPEWFLGQYWMSEHDLSAWVENFPANTDDHPMVEFSRVISIEPNFSVMQQLAAMKTDYGRFFNATPSENEKETLQELEKIHEYNKNVILGVIEAINYYRDQEAKKKSLR